jgi:hypothetical protein
VTLAIDVESVRDRPDAVIFPLALGIATAIFSDDAALYAAKRAGRDRVCAAGADPVAV